MVISHTTDVLLYSFLARMHKKELLPTCRAAISGVFSSVNNELLTSQTTLNLEALVLQLKVALDPSVALTDVGVSTNSAIKNKNITESMTVQVCI